MAEQSALVNISEMIDLAIGTPDVGVVDFGMLQTVLHCLAQQLRVLDKNVELRGSAANLPVGRDTGLTIAVNEYIVDTEGAPTTPSTKAKGPPLPPLKVTPEMETILVVERVKRDALGSGPKSASAPPSIAGQQTSTPTPASVTPPTERLNIVTLSKFNILENTVEDLRNRVYGSVPKNEEILEEVRSQTNLKAITDMWTSLNVSTRLEAAEAGIGKLSSLIEDQIRDSAGLQNQLDEALNKLADLQNQQKAALGISAQLSQLGGVGPQLSAVGPQMAGVGPQLAEADPQQAKAGPQPADAGPQLTSASQMAQTGPPPDSQDVAALNKYLEKIRSDVDNLTETLKTELAVLKPAAGLSKDLARRITDLEKRLKECCDKIGKNDGVMQDQVTSVQDQLQDMMKHVANLTEGKLSPDLLKDLQGLMSLFETVKDMQDQLKQVHDTAIHLAAEKDNRQYNMNAILEQIELLKTIKMDREDMVEAMAEKADLRLLARKVSHDQFEMACDDLSKGLEHALGKLNLQEALWQQALDDIQREIEMKLDKMELGPVRDFFNNKLRQLQDNLKQLASLRREVEAAGTKQRLLRDVTCISCDANAVMQMDAESIVPKLKPLPPTHSMKPYLSYELDAIRKAQATNVQQRNMHDWEHIDKQMTQKQPQKVRSETGKHICNRYCGGSHTVTTAAQRVSRLGHFVKQWGPDVVPLSSGLAAGDDGKMYKVTATEAANVGPGGAVDTTCTPKSPKATETMKAQKPIFVTPECRCLEADKAAPKK